MGKFLIALSFALPLSAFAQLRCVDKLLPIPRPSASHQLADNEWRPGTEVMLPEDAQRAVNSLVFGKLLCRDNEIEFTTLPTCAPIDATMPGSNTCYYSSNLGYFIITQDTAKNANFIFHKVKRTADEI